MRQASVELNLQRLHLTPHLARHGGISTDVFERVLSLEEGAKRGHWRSMNSVRRYEKHARLLKMLSKLTDAQRAAADQATECIGDILLSRR